MREADRGPGHALGLALGCRPQLVRESAAAGELPERIPQQCAPGETLGAPPGVRKCRAAFPIGHRGERGHELVGEVAPIGIIKVQRTGAAHYAARRKTGEVSIPFVDDGCAVTRDRRRSR